MTEGTNTYAPGTFATGTRLPLTQRESPQSVSVVTRQEMEDFNLTSIDDVMKHTPGVSTVTYDSERTVYYAHGFAIMNYQYDGVPVIRDSAYSAGHSLTDMVPDDRVEVLKGATGLLTDVGDPGATINHGQRGQRPGAAVPCRGAVGTGGIRLGPHQADSCLTTALHQRLAIRSRPARIPVAGAGPERPPEAAPGPRRTDPGPRSGNERSGPEAASFISAPRFQGLCAGVKLSSPAC